MPFAFSELSTLLSRVEDIELSDPPILRTAEKDAQIRIVVESWFKSHGSAIDKLPPNEMVALLSALLPERRTDRVYGIQSATLCKILSRTLGLSAARAKDLQAYRTPGAGDLALCLERVLRSSGPPAHPPVQLIEIDDMLATLAASCRFSDPSSRIRSTCTQGRDSIIGSIVKRLDPSHGKWLVRLILKDFSPVRLHETLILRSFHFLLPDLLHFQNNFDAAVRQLKDPLTDFPARPDPRSQLLHRQSAALVLRPEVGIKIGRPTFLKGRGIDSCIGLCGKKRWVLERKYDGEYCEVHIDIGRSARPSECITIFSKSGKNSTADRQKLHQTLVECLRLDHPERAIKRQAILLGEMVVYSDRDQRILPFEIVRRHVSRSGVFLGTDEDSPTHADEHLAIVFFDLLLLDDEMILSQPVEKRRERLRQVYTKLAGRAMGAEWKIVDFRHPQQARRTLIHQFAASIAQRCEGLVLKRCGKPYFGLERSGEDNLNAYIKLKKDYIDGMGDEADFAVVGGSYDGQHVLPNAMPNLRWNTFYLGCLLNKAEVVRFDARPRVKVVGAIQAEYCMPRAVLESANTLGTFCAKPYVRDVTSTAFDVESAPNSMDTYFSTPFVFEVLGTGFDKPPNCGFFMLRFPRVKKLHQDRDWKDCVSFQDLQEQAIAARQTPPEGETQETIKLIEKLEMKCKKRNERGQTSTPKTLNSPREFHGTHPQGLKRSTPRTTATSLDGTTLVHDGLEGRKRLRGLPTNQTPCPVAKKRRTDHHIHKPGHADRDAITIESVSSPLADITNSALGSSPALRSHSLIEAVKDPNRMAVNTTPFKIGSRLQYAPTTSSSPAAIDSNPRDCERSSCFFTQAAVYPSPCIVNTPYIMQDLLSTHSASIVSTLVYWDREVSESSPLAHTVQESPAYEGLRKIVLVEARRKRAVKETVRRVLELNRGHCRERIEFWDWRVMESDECKGHYSFARDDTMRHFLGSTVFDKAGKRAVFVPWKDGTNTVRPCESSS